MNKLLSAFSRAARAVWSIFAGTPDAIVAAIEAGLLAAKPYFPIALEISEFAAALTPVTIDDVIVAFAKKYQVDASEIIIAGRPQGDIIRDLVRLVLRKAFPGAADRWLNRAIELAYAKVNP